MNFISKIRWKKGKKRSKKGRSPTSLDTLEITGFLKMGYKIEKKPLFIRLFSVFYR